MNNTKTLNKNDSTIQNMTFQKVKGTSDYYPEEMKIRNLIKNSLSSAADRFGFQEISFPSIETMDLLTKKSGEEIKTQIFRLEKQGKEELGLRFEATASSARMFIDIQKKIPKPVKWYCTVQNWRYEQPQKGRDREFFQFNAEIYGSSNTKSDAEVISLAIECLKSLGLKESDFIVKINNRKLLSGFLNNITKKDKEAIIRIIDKKEKISKDEFNNELKSLKLTEDNIKDINTFINADSFKEIESLNLNNDAQDGLQELKTLFQLLKIYKNIKFMPSIARGLAYYTGTVFEIFDSKGKFRSICGGGRYDNMIKLFGGQDEAATGFAIGLSTLTLLLKEKKLIKEEDDTIDYYIVSVNPMTDDTVFEIASKLRKKYSVVTDINGRNLKKQFNEANKLNAKKVIIVGEEELKTNSVKLKDMESGKEKLVKIENL